MRRRDAQRNSALRLGRENSRWGYLRIRGELLKLGVDVSGTTIATVLRRNGLGPAPRRIGPTWTQFLRLQAYGLVSPGAPSEEDEDLKERAAVPQPPSLVPLSDGPATGRRTYPCRPVGTEQTSHPDGGRSPPCVRNAGSAARWNSRSRRARDRRLNLFASGRAATSHRSFGPLLRRVDRPAMPSSRTSAVASTTSGPTYRLLPALPTRSPNWPS